MQKTKKDFTVVNKGLASTKLKLKYSAILQMLLSSQNITHEIRESLKS